jgi:uncharacterized protein
VKALWWRLCRCVNRWPAPALIVAAALAALGGWRATRLELRTGFADLLPPNQPSVVELHRVAAATRGLANVFVVLESPDVGALRRLADALLPRLEALGPPAVESAEDGVRETRAFLLPRAGLFASEAQLDQLLDDIKAHERWAFQRSIGADLSEPPPPLDAASVRRSLAGPDLDQLRRFPDGYYQGPAGGGRQALVVIARAAIAEGDLTGARRALQQIQQRVAATMSARPADAALVKVGYAGDLVTGLAEYSLVRDDLLDVGSVGLALVLAVVVLFFRGPGPLLALGATIGVGVALTFAVADFAIGHLNVATAFLFSIVAGNGINFGILFLARYVEERRRGCAADAALYRALSRTWAPTLTAACAAAAAYGALALSSFRGFREFAIIGAAGMLLCWLVSYTLLPALTVVSERVRYRWLDRRPEGDGRVGWGFERPFVSLVAAAPRAVAIGGVGLALVGVVAGALYAKHDPLEYNMRRLQSDPGATTELYRISTLAASIVGASAEGAMVVVTDDPRDTPPAAAALRRTRDAAPPDAKPFQAVHTLYDFVPPDQPRRLVQVQELARRLRRARERGAFSDEEWGQLAPMLPPADLHPFGVADLPAPLTRAFTTRDGVAGRLIYIEPTAGRNDSDLHYLLLWADAFRETRLPDGRVVRGSGRAVIFADLLQSTFEDMPRAILLSLGLTAGAVLLLFRRVRPSAWVLATLAVGLCWMAGVLFAARIRLNFINLIALPITFGIGVDYAVNLLGRYRAAPEAGIIPAMRGAGGPVVLCSLTTSLGYLALLRSHNQAVRSLGLVAVLGEATCLLAAMVVLPASLRWIELRSGGRKA